MTVYEYLIRLPQPLFEATLMGLMGLPVNSPQEDVIHEWLQSPCEKYFGQEAAKDIANTSQIVGRNFTALFDEEQEKIRRAMKDYFELCEIGDVRITQHPIRVLGIPVFHPHCDRCVNLSLTEEEQEARYNAGMRTKSQLEHRCLFYDRRVRHQKNSPHNTPPLIPCGECIEDLYLNYEEVDSHGPPT